MAASSLLEIADNVATITLCREKEKNTMDAAMLGTLMDQLKQCMEDDAVHVIVLTNTGNTFCAGANLKDVGQAAPGGSSLVDILKFMQQGKKIIVGKINGHCTGGGVGLAAACDLSVIRGDAQVGFSEVRVGAAPAMISVICLPKMSRGKAAEMMLLGLKVPAQKATEAGLFNECVPPQDIDSKVEEWVDHLRHGGPQALGTTKALIYRVPQMAQLEAFQWTQELSMQLFKSQEASDGIMAFMARKKAPWAPQKKWTTQAKL